MPRRLQNAGSETTNCTRHTVHKTSILHRLAAEEKEPPSTPIQVIGSRLSGTGFGRPNRRGLNESQKKNGMQKLDPPPLNRSDRVSYISSLSGLISPTRPCTATSVLALHCYRPSDLVCGTRRCSFRTHKGPPEMVMGKCNKKPDISRLGTVEIADLLREEISIIKSVFSSLCLPASQRYECKLVSKQGIPLKLPSRHFSRE